MLRAAAPNLAAPYIIGQSGVPFILAGSGSMGNNGALTLTTALASTPAITSAYVYLPAGAIASGVPAAAGWYYALFSSTTAATVYNNTYTSGTPAVPASPTAFATTGPGAYTGISTAVNAYQLTIPGNTFGLNGGIEVSAAWSYTNAAGTKTMAMSYGSFAFLSFTATTTATQTGFWGLKNAGATNAQIATSIGGNSPLGNSTGSLATGSVDTTSAQTLSFPLTNATPATNNLMLGPVTVEVIPGVA